MTSMGDRPTTVDEYLQDVTTEEKVALQHLRRTIQKACPQAEEVISYGMPAYKFKGMLLWFTVHENHCGLYVRPGNVKALDKELAPYRSSKSTLRFTPEKPLPDALVTKIVKDSMRANQAREAENKEKKAATPKKKKK